VFIAGRVVDGNGEPAPHVQVAVARWTRMGGEGAPETWNWTSSVGSPNTDAEGRFELRDDPPPGRYALAARSNSFGFGAFVPFERGQTDVVVRLPASGGLAGRLELAPGVEVVSLRVRATAAGGQAFRDTTEVLARPDASFEFEGLEPGPYRVDVRRVWDDAEFPLLVVDGVVVTEGKTRRDPRIDPLDLRDALHPLALELLETHGAAVHSGHVELRPHGDPEARAVFAAFEHGLLRVSGSGRSSDLVVRAPGHRSLRLEDVRGERRVVLEPGLPVRVRIPSDVLAVLPGTGSLRLGFFHASSPRREMRAVRGDQGRHAGWWGGSALLEVPLEGRDELALLLPEPGTWNVGWTWVAADSRTSTGVRADIEPNTFEVPADGTPVHVRLSPDLTDLARVLAR
jgi:hypothetical protein